jgi:hypothetical protein
MVPTSPRHPAAATGDQPVPSDPADVYRGFEALAEFADEHGLTGLSPASLRPIEQPDTPFTGAADTGSRFVGVTPAPRWTGDVKDHPGYGPVTG